MTSEPIMPIKVTPYEHQQKAFIFACKVLGVLDGAYQSNVFSQKKEGDANDSNQ